jgi:hypothetical protein
MTSIASRALRRLVPWRRTSTSEQRSTFTEIFRANAWESAESVSGRGSTQARGMDFRASLVSLLDAYAIQSILDAPCGDCTWMRDVLEERPLQYTGVDIVEALIAENVRTHGTATRRFLCLDMSRDDLPAADLVLCRDGLVHLSFADARAAIRNFRRSGARYLLTTTFVGRARNTDTPTGGWRPLNLEAAPFGFPAPLALVDERCPQAGGAYHDKHLGLWDLAAIAGK